MLTNLKSCISSTLGRQGGVDKKTLDNKSGGQAWSTLWLQLVICFWAEFSLDFNYKLNRKKKVRTGRVYKLRLSKSRTGDR